MSALLDQILHKFSATTFVQISPTIDMVPGKTPELCIWMFQYNCTGITKTKSSISLLNVCHLSPKAILNFGTIAFAND